MSAGSRLDSLLDDEIRKRSVGDAEGADYLRVHANRYAFLLEVVGRSIQGLERPRILDVGAGWEADALRSLVPRAVVDTLGFDDPRLHPREREHQITFDLNDVPDRDRRPDIGQYDLVVAAEVLEHLHTAPELVLGFLAELVRPGGDILVQTPNAVALTKRLRMLRGRNPYERIRRTPGNPGHFREYTVDELHAIGAEAGLRVVECEMRNYFRHMRGFARHLHGRERERLVPPAMRDGITIRYRKRG